MSSVLVVDDDIGTLETFGAALRLAGYDVALAPTAQKGLTLARQLRFDLILADRRLPDLDGVDMLRQLRQSGTRVPFVIVTGFGSQDSSIEATRLGAVAYLDKPLFVDSLLDVVRRYGGDNSPVRMLGHEITIGSATGRGDEPGQCGTGYAVRRWADLVMLVMQAADDVPTVAEWARLAGHSRATLCARCDAAGIVAGASLDFARALRLVRIHAGRTCQWYNVVDILDSRTLDSFLERAAFDMTSPLPDLPTFLRTQHFITSPMLVSAVAACLDVSGL